MKIQIKQFSFGTLNNLIAKADFINETNGKVNKRILERWKHRMPQPILYAIETEEGSFTILNNNVINSLDYRLKEAAFFKERRELINETIQICILFSSDYDEQETFKSLI